jgi:acyl-CoA synthetase (AMP-forming)/AMP-acid ligase II
MPADSGGAQPAVATRTWIDGQPTDLPTWPTFDENTASSMCYTSGTTGNPEGRALQPPLDAAAHLCDRAAGRDGPVGARRDAAGGADVPRQRLGPAVRGGADRRQAGVPRPGLDGKSVYELFEAEGVTFAAGVPTVWQMPAGPHEANNLRSRTLRAR